MHVTDLAINKTLGMRLAASGSDHVLEMPEMPLLLNHVGTVHASVQFALAEASSGEFLLRRLDDVRNNAFAMLRTSEVKFRKPARGSLRASARFADGVADPDRLLAELAARRRASVSVFIEIADAQGVITMTGNFDWFLQRQSNPD
jgi:acyl-coenzyme A thioesterase PaaI-like protein